MPFEFSNEEINLSQNNIHKVPATKYLPLFKSPYLSLLGHSSDILDLFYSSIQAEVIRAFDTTKGPEGAVVIQEEGL